MSIVLRRIARKRSALAPLSSRPVVATLARATFSTSRPLADSPPPDAAPPPWRRGLRYEIWDYARGRFEAARKRALIVGVGLAAAVGYAVYAWGPTANEDSAFNAFEKGALGGMGNKWDNDTSATVPRPELGQALGQVLRPRTMREYAVVIGEHGTGKSTAVRKEARLTGSDGANGVVYYHVGDEVDQFVKGLAAALGYSTATVDVQGGASRFVSQTTKEEAAPTWADLEAALIAAAAAFKAKHGRPATLVLDNVDVIAKDDPAFMIKLQRFAKAMADDGSLRVVFVSSDGTAPALMMAQSEWSRAEDPMEVGDIDDEAARAYLQRAGIRADMAALIVDRIAGGRFALLKKYIKDEERIKLLDTTTVEAKVEQLDGEVLRDLAKLQVAHGHAFFMALLQSKRIGTRGFVESGLTEDKLAALLKANIIAAHPDGSYTFHSRFVERYFEKLAVTGAAAAGMATAGSAAAGTMVGMASGVAGSQA